MKLSVSSHGFLIDIFIGSMSSVGVEQKEIIILKRLGRGPASFKIDAKQKHNVEFCCGNEGNFGLQSKLA